MTLSRIADFKWRKRRQSRIISFNFTIQQEQPKHE